MKIETDNGVEHSCTRVYVFNCTYPNQSTIMQDDPQILLDIVRYELDRFQDFTYKTLKISNVVRTSVIGLEIHIDGVEYFGSDRLNAIDSDNLRFDIQELLSGISSLSYERVDIVADRFLENPTFGFINQSMSRAN